MSDTTTGLLAAMASKRDYSKWFKQGWYDGDIGAFLQSDQVFLVYEAFKKHFVLHAHASDDVQELFLHVAAANDYEFGVDFFQDLWNSINQNVNAFFVNQSSDEKHNFLFRQGKLVAEKTSSLPFPTFS